MYSFISVVLIYLFFICIPAIWKISGICHRVSEGGIDNKAADSRRLVVWWRRGWNKRCLYCKARRAQEGISFIYLICTKCLEYLNSSIAWNVSCSFRCFFHKCVYRTCLKSYVEFLNKGTVFTMIPAKNNMLLYMSTSVPWSNWGVLQGGYRKGTGNRWPHSLYL